MNWMDIQFSTFVWKTLAKHLAKDSQHTSV